MKLDLEFVSSCPVCERIVPVSGENGVVRHVLGEHPESTFATAIEVELEQWAAEVSR